MCGRLDVNGEALNRAVSVELDLRFRAASNRDLRPTQTVSTVTLRDGALHQLDTYWGIKPSWATSQLINAKVETVTEKQTFTKAFALHRCVVPCSGFYEWMDTQKGKVKLRFHRPDGQPLYMGAFWYEGEQPKVVTLTTVAPIEHQAVHHRFPVFIDAAQCEAWLKAHPVDAQSMASEPVRQTFSVEPVA